jgi:tetratricopeptide (TPR) repeat protein
MNSTNTALTQGKNLEQSGNLPAAETVYQQAIATNQNWAEGWYRLGVVSLRQKKLPEAITCFENARHLNFMLAETWNFQGIALGWLMRKPEAEFAFRQAIAIQPKFANAHLNLGIAAQQLNKTEDAAASFRMTLSLEPNNITALEQLAAICWSQGRQQESLDCLYRLLQIQPRYVPAICALSSHFFEMGRQAEAEQGFRAALQLDPSSVDGHIGLGVLQGSQKRFEDAARSFLEAVRLNPNSGRALANLGNAQRELGRLADAETNLARAIELEPESAITQLNMGALRLSQRMLDVALEHMNRALALDPLSANCLAGIAAIYTERGELDKAELLCRRAISIDPKSAQSHHNLAMIQLVRGNWKEGFQEWEWRWKTNTFREREYKQPSWNGESLSNETLLVYCEQGFGDSLQFCRYLQLVRERVKNVVLEAPRRLVNLLRNYAGVDRLIAEGDELPKFDCHVSMMSLPRIFNTTFESVPCNLPYLTAEPERIAKWRSKIGSVEDFRIGIAWRGSPAYGRDKDRSILLPQFAPLGTMEGVKLFSLHQGDVSSEIDSVRKHFEVVDFGNELDASGGAFLDTAALMKCLDLVISIDSAAIHLAGALDVPAWLLLSKVPDWRWTLHGETSPWYPNLRIFRQASLGDWQQVFERIAAELRLRRSKIHP